MKLKCYISIEDVSDIKTGIQEAFNKSNIRAVLLTLEYDYRKDFLDIEKFILKINNITKKSVLLECLILLPNSDDIIMSDYEIELLMKDSSCVQELKNLIRKSFTTYKSDMVTYRNNKLIYQGDGPTKEDMPVLTAELYSKWYTLYLLKTDGTIEEFNPPIEEVGYLDNKWNPLELEEYCEKNDIYIDELFYEMLVGRWELEVKNNY
jgi:hypothetical protein